MLHAAFEAPWVASWFERNNVRHVHAHFATEAASVAMPTARLLRVRYTFTAHALDIYVRTRGLCVKARSAARIVTVCDYNVKQLLQQCPELPHDHLSVVYCGVDTTEFTLRTPRAAHSTLELLSVGRLVPKKGFADLIEAVAIVRGRGIDVTCDIIGDGHIREELEAAIDHHAVRGHVTLLGPRPNEDVRAALGACDAFVLACVVDEDGDRDSMPVVLKEAMAVGVPVIATDEVGIPELVDDSVGWLTPPNDPQALADAIASMAALSSDQRHVLGLAGRERVVSRFDVRHETARLIDVFREVIKSTSADA